MSYTLLSFCASKASWTDKPFPLSLESFRSYIPFFFLTRKPDEHSCQYNNFFVNVVSPERIPLAVQIARGSILDKHFARQGIYRFASRIIMIWINFTSTQLHTIIRASSENQQSRPNKGKGAFFLWTCRYPPRQISRRLESMWMVKWNLCYSDNILFWDNAKEATYKTMVMGSTNESASLPEQEVASLTWPDRSENTTRKCEDSDEESTWQRLTPPPSPPKNPFGHL